jgi:ribosomal protein S12 methylthiotransferase
MGHKRSARQRVAIVSLGCAKNLVDSEHIASLLEALGVEVCTDPTSAEVAVVNTCGFIDDAKEESVDAILEVADCKGKGLRTLVVTGCLSERYADELREEIPEADVVLGVDPHMAARAVLEALDISDPLPARCDLRAHRFTPRSWAYLRIADGCDNRCAYCVIPSIRGGLVSRPMDEILDEAERLIETGVKEINVIAQDTTAYGRDRGRPALHKLLNRLSSLCADDVWLRVLYTHPAHYYPELIDALASEPAICPYIDIPLQHINDRILDRMGRGVTRDDIEKLIERLRCDIPNLTLRTTFIVGFPGESEEDFGELLEFVQAARFDRMGVFTYSVEEGTAAAGFSPHVPDETKNRRRHALMMAQQDIAFEKAASRIGETATVLLEDERDPETGFVLARSIHEAPDVDPFILVRGQPLPTESKTIDVKIVDSLGYDSLAEVVS